MFFFLAAWFLVTLATASSLLLLRFVVFGDLPWLVGGLLPVALVVLLALSLGVFPVSALADEARLVDPADVLLCAVDLGVDAADFFGLAAGLADDVDALLALAGAVFFFGLPGASVDAAGWVARLDAALPLAGAVLGVAALSAWVAGLADERLRVFVVAVGTEAAFSAVRRDDGDDLGVA